MRKKVFFITGGAGFIGTKLIKKLLDDNAGDIYVYDKLHPQVHGSKTPKILNSVQFIKEDIVNVAALKDSLNIADPDYIVHLASETGTGQSMDLPVRYCDANVSGTAALLEALREISMPHKKRHLVLSSSRSIYGEGAYLTEDNLLVSAPSRTNESMANGVFDIEVIDGKRSRPIETPESLPANPSSVYASTKLLQEQLITQLCPLANCTYSILRFQNVYGPGQSLDNPYTGVLSIFVDIIKKGGKLEIYEDGAISRDFIYVDDVVDAILKSLVVRNHISPINIGSGSPTTILAVAKILLKLMDRPATDLYISGKFRVGDVRYAVANIENAKKILNWHPKITMEQGLKELVNWSTI